jgi:hypothetical protein
MVARVLIAAVVIVVAALVALVLRRRTAGTDAPTQPRHSAPEQLDRNDFAAPEAPWLVAVFSSASCQTCANVVTKAKVLASEFVAVEEIEYTARRPLHEKYAIDGVPCLVVADALGVVRASFLGPVSATDLWAAVADVRDPGARPDHVCERDHDNAQQQ